MNPERKINFNVFAFIYFLIFSVSVIFNEENPYLKFPKLDAFFWKNMSVDISLGLIVGGIIVFISWILTRKSKLFKDLVKMFQTLLGPLTLAEIFFIAAFSSLAEEFFFRGMMQAKLGIVFSSLLFGVLHTGPGKKYVPWTIFAVVMGFVLGGLYEWRQNLMLPVVIHFVVNFVNLIWIQHIKLSEES